MLTKRTTKDSLKYETESQERNK